MNNRFLPKPSWYIDYGNDKNNYHEKNISQDFAGKIYRRWHVVIRAIRHDENPFWGQREDLPQEYHVVIIIGIPRVQEYYT
jgi:hypothetical protein